MSGVIGVTWTGIGPLGVPGARKHRGVLGHRGARKRRGALGPRGVLPGPRGAPGAPGARRHQVAILALLRHGPVGLQRLHTAPPPLTSQVLLNQAPKPLPQNQNSRQLQREFKRDFSVLDQFRGQRKSDTKLSAG